MEEDFQYDRDTSASSIRCLIPCPECIESGNTVPDVQNDFTMEDLIIEATYETRQEILCKRKKHTLRLKTLVPDVFLGDLQVCDKFSLK